MSDLEDKLNNVSRKTFNCGCLLVIIGLTLFTFIGCALLLMG